MRSTLLVFLALSVVNIAFAQGQGQRVTQNTSGVCSPAVVAGGNVTITCQGTNAEQRALLNKLPSLIERMLKTRQADQDVLLTKINELLDSKGDIKRLESKIDDIRTEISKINHYVASLISGAPNASDQRKSFSARLYVITLKLKPSAANVLSDFPKGLVFFNTVENVPSSVPAIQLQGAWGLNGPIQDQKENTWSHVAYILSDDAAVELKNHLATLPEVQAAQVDYVDEAEEKNLLPLIAKLGAGAASGGGFPEGFQSWSEKRKLDPDALNIFNPNVKQPAVQTSSRRYRELLEQERSILIPQPHSLTIDQWKDHMVKRGEFAKQLKVSFESRQITKQEFDYLTGLNRRHGLGQK